MEPNRSQNRLKMLPALLRWLRHNPQHSVPLSLLALYLGVWLIAPRHRPQTVPVPSAPPVIAVPPPLAPPLISAPAPNKPLFQRAAKITDTNGYWNWTGGYEEYRWLSNHEFLYSDYTGGGNQRVPDCRLFRYDTQTRTRTQLRRLTKLVDCFYHSQMEISPDGKWMLWHGGTDGRETIDAATLDGKRHIQWPGGFYSLHTLAWTADSRHWIDFERTTSNAPDPTLVHIHDVNDPRKDTVLPIAEGSLLENTRIARTIVSISTPEYQKITTQLQVTEAQIGSRITPIHHYTIRPPANLVNPDIAASLLSPDGSRIAVVIGYDTPPSSRKPQQRAYGLWVCQKDGSAMREVGDWLEETNPNRILELQAMRWLPNGKRLSFVYKASLWTVGAE